MSEATDDLRVSPRVRVPAAAMRVSAVRASGPGGQNVNKVATKVELLVDLSAIDGLSEPQRARLMASARGRLDGDGHLRITSQRTRSRAMNTEDVREKLRALIVAALPAPKRRVPTKPSRAARARRLSDKRRQSEKKSSRRFRTEG